MVEIIYEHTTHTTGAVPAGDTTTINSVIDSAKTEGFRITKIEGTIGVVDVTGGSEGNPYTLYYHQLGISAAEVEEALEADPSSSQDVPNVEKAKRFIHMWPGAAPGTGGLFRNADGGFFFSVTPKGGGISLREGTGMGWTVANPAGGATLPSATWTFNLKYYGVWLRD